MDFAFLLLRGGDRLRQSLIQALIICGPWHRRYPFEYGLCLRSAERAVEGRGILSGCRRCGGYKHGALFPPGLCNQLRGLRELTVPVLRGLPAIINDKAQRAMLFDRACRVIDRAGQSQNNQRRDQEPQQENP